ncbi:HlyD family type I secretion periplasmic adaptor subunit [Achromobacter sp. DH1f]|uniref:HlyD family type I secretion periplasmic adaptor subunit n=1 Tax=Achromobacter sp. DH1f TaxID=1397275 RepID=UPI0004683C39|nr:HlyD family type I secretion periplasmic adaptor subunit [Achromobacter sp. DH1f]
MKPDAPRPATGGRLPTSVGLRLRRLLPRTVTGLVALGMLVFLVWAAAFPLEVYVRGNGVVRVERHNILIQAQEGGVIRRMAVKEGDMVTAGTLLAEVENSNVDEAYAKSAVTRAALLAKEYRLQREVAGEPMPSAVPADLVPAADVTAASLGEAYASELETHRLRNAAQEQSESVLAAQMSQREAESQELKSQAADLQKEAALQEQQVRMIEPMIKSGAAAEGVLLQKRADLQRIRSSLNQARARLPRVQAERQEAESRLGQVRADFLSRARQDLNEAQMQLSRLGAEAQANTGRKDAARILAPGDSQVHRVIAPHEGMVIKPGGELLELSPTDVPLIAEIRVKPEDRDHIWVGMAGRVRISALSGAGRALPARVTVISPDAISEPNGDRYYVVSLSVDAGLNTQRVRPGMSVEAFLEAGQRTLLAYLAKPLYQAAETALSEPGGH